MPDGPRIARDRAINRLDPNYLAEWRMHYSKLVLAFVEGWISLDAARLQLVSLGFRDQALDIELHELQRALVARALSRRGR